MQELRFTAIKVLFFLLFSGLTLLQVFSFPGQFQHMRRMQGLSLLLEISLIFMVGLLLCCGQVALICLWRITEAIRVGLFFSHSNIVWIGRLLRAFKVASAIPVILILILAPQADDPGFFVMLSILMLFIFSLTVITSLLKEVIRDQVNN